MGGIIGAETDGNGGMNVKASALIIVGVGWIAVALLFLFSPAGIGIPGWMPRSLVVPIFIAFEVTLFVGWLIPLAAGIRLLMKRR